MRNDTSAAHRRRTGVGGIVHDGMDITARFVRVVERRPDGFVEFEFAIGDPDIYVEMILPISTFDDFCDLNHVEFLPEVPDHVDDPWSWRIHDATHAHGDSNQGSERP